MSGKEYLTAIPWAASAAAFIGTTGPQSTIPKDAKITFGSVAQPAGQYASRIAEGASKMDEALLNAKIEAVEARTDTKFAQLIGKIDAVGERLTSIQTQISTLATDVKAVDGHARSGKGVIIATVIATGAAVVGLAYAAVQIHDFGMSITQAAFQAGMAAAPTIGHQKSPPPGQGK